MLSEQIHVAVPTAFHKDESLHTQATIKHIWHLYRQGIRSVLVVGTTGEQHSLSLQEKIELLEALVTETDLLLSMEVIFGVSSIRQSEAAVLAAHLRDTDIAGIMLGFPPYILPTQKEAVSYAKQLIEWSNKPTILYNNPKRTGFDLSTASIVELSQSPLVVGVKDAGDKEKIATIKRMMGQQAHDFYFYAGGEVNLAEKIYSGYNRLSSIAGNVYPIEVEQWFEHLYMDQPIGEKMMSTMKNIMQEVYEGNAIVKVKHILQQRGESLGECRKPIGNG